MNDWLPFDFDLVAWRRADDIRAQALATRPPMWTAAMKQTASTVSLADYFDDTDQFGTCLLGEDNGWIWLASTAMDIALDGQPAVALGVTAIECLKVRDLSDIDHQIVEHWQSAKRIRLIRNLEGRLTTAGEPATWEAEFWEQMRASGQADGSQPVTGAGFTAELDLLIAGYLRTLLGFDPITEDGWSWAGNLYQFG